MVPDVGNGVSEGGGEIVLLIPIPGFDKGIKVSVDRYDVCSCANHLNLAD